jgi:hypothetical protein
MFRSIAQGSISISAHLFEIHIYIDQYAHSNPALQTFAFGLGWVRWFDSLHNATTPKPFRRHPKRTLLSEIAIPHMLLGAPGNGGPRGFRATVQRGDLVSFCVDCLPHPYMRHKEMIYMTRSSRGVRFTST